MNFLVAALSRSLLRSLGSCGHRSLPWKCAGGSPRRLGSYWNLWKTARFPQRSPSPTPASTRSVLRVLLSRPAAAVSRRPTTSPLGRTATLYVAGNGGAVLRYDGTTGAYINTFVSQGSGGLSFGGIPAGLGFGPDGNLFVASGATNQVLEYNGSTGAFVKSFVSAGSGGLNYPAGLTFGPDGSLYVSSWGTEAILRYQGPLAGSPGTPLPAQGQSGATFVAPSSGGLVEPENLDLRPRREPLRRWR